MKTTKKQHLIPRMILKHHTYFQIPMRKPMIYQYDKNKNIERLVDIKDVCRKNNFYEIKKENGEINERYRNTIEKILSKYESKWNHIINKIVKEEELKEDDILFLYALITIQTIRMPKFIGFVSKKINEIKPNMNKYEIDKIAKISSLLTTNDEKANWNMNCVLKIIMNKELTILHTNETLVLNGDNPVLLLIPYQNCNPYEIPIYFPITSHYCLSLTKNKLDFTEMPIEMFSWLNRENFKNETKCIYSAKSIKKEFNQTTKD